MSSVSVTLPALGESVTEGTVTRWLKQVGDSVEADEPLLEVSTDKVDTEVPSPAAGTLLSITAQEDDSVEVGGELGVIGDSADPPGDSGDAAPDDAAPNGGASKAGSRAGRRGAGRRRGGQLRRDRRGTGRLRALGVLGGARRPERVAASRRGGPVRRGRRQR